MKKLIPWWGWALLIFLAISAALISLGQSEDNAKPVAASFAPSGTAAFLNLLKDRGLPVIVDGSADPAFLPHDLVITFTTPTDLFLTTTSAEKHCRAAIIRHLKSGGEVLHLPLSKDFRAASRSALAVKPATVHKNLPGENGNSKHDGLAIYSSSQDESENLLGLSQSGPEVVLWQGGTFSARAIRIKRGTLVRLSDGLLATNRFIDQGDDARFLVSVIEAIRPTGGRIVFAEASSGNGYEPGFLESIGHWALAVWYQLLFVGLAVIISLSIPFGLPEPRRQIQRGARELVDAIASTMSRSRSAKTSVELALQTLLPPLRKVYGISFDAPPSELMRRLPPESSKAIGALAVAANEDQLKPSQALTLIKQAETSVADIIRIPKRAGAAARKRILKG